MTVDTGAVMTVGLALVAGLIWLIRLEGRVETNKQLFLAFEGTIKSDISEIKADLKQLINRLLAPRNSDL